MKQTAVEWFVNELDLSNDTFTMKIINQAKAMEKEQIMEAFKEGVAYWNGDEWQLIDIEEYYNNKFKKK